MMFFDETCNWYNKELIQLFPLEFNSRYTRDLEMPEYPFVTIGGSNFSIQSAVTRSQVAR